MMAAEAIIFAGIGKYIFLSIYRYLLIYVAFILSISLEQAQLRNEIYCQLIKQVTDNPNSNYEQRGWELMAMCCSSFPPNHYLLKYVGSFLMEKSLKNNYDFAQFAGYCLRRLEKTVNIITL